MYLVDNNFDLDTGLMQTDKIQYCNYDKCNVLIPVLSASIVFSCRKNNQKSSALSIRQYCRKTRTI